MSFLIHGQKSETNSTTLYLQENPLLIHHPKDEKDNRSFTKDYEKRIKTPQILLKTEQQRLADTVETNRFGQHISYDRIHSIYFQPCDMLTMPFVVNPIIEQAHQQETISAADKHHRARPNRFNHRKYFIPDPTQNNQSNTNTQK